MLRNFISQAAMPLASLDLVEEINHRVVNQYAEAVSLLSLAAAQAPTSDARASLEHAASRLLTHADLHRALLRPMSTGMMDLAEHLCRIGEAFSKAFLADRGVRIMMETEQAWLSADRCWRIGLIVAELVRNAARHGLSGKSGLIVVGLRARPGWVACLVSDTGRSIANPKPGRGRALIQSLATELGAMVEWRFTDMGSMAHIDFPMNSPADTIADTVYAIN
jgi:two-component sensor histidine kinase